MEGGLLVGGMGGREGEGEEEKNPGGVIDLAVPALRCARDGVSCER